MDWFVQGDGDEYVYKGQEEEDDEYEDLIEVDDADTSIAQRDSAGGRRTTRGNGTRPKDDWSDWRGERRSTRLGAPSDTQLDGPPPKRARTDDSATSGNSGEAAPATSGKANSGLKIKINGAAAMKPTETAVEAIAGKKKSKFWFYAVEPVSGAPLPAANGPPSTSSAPQSEGEKAGIDMDIPEQHNGNSTRYPSTTPSASGSNADELYEKSVGGSSSPASEEDMDVS